MTECEAQLVKKTATRKFASAEAEASFRKNFLAECMASK
jgi:hypothetical protein